MDEKELFKTFMKAQVIEIEKYYCLKCEKLGYDVGICAKLEWIQLYAKDFRKKWFDNNPL